MKMKPCARKSMIPEVRARLQPSAAAGRDVGLDKKKVQKPLMKIEGSK